MTTKKPDCQRAQRMLRKAHRKIAKECGFSNEVFEFAVILNWETAAFVTELVGSDKLMQPGGIDEVANFVSGQLASALRETLLARADHKMRKVRH